MADICNDSVSHVAIHTAIQRSPSPYGQRLLFFYEIVLFQQGFGLDVVCVDILLEVFA